MSSQDPDGISGLAMVLEALTQSRCPTRLPTEWLSPCPAHPGLGVSGRRKCHDSGLSPLDFPPSPSTVFWAESFVSQTGVSFGKWQLTRGVGMCPSCSSLCSSGGNRKPQGWKGLAGVGDPLCFLERGAGFPEGAAAASPGPRWTVVCPPPPPALGAPEAGPGLFI